MRLLRQYIKNLLVEQEEEERTDEEKLKELFLHNAVQALHIAQQVDVDPEMVEHMNTMVDAVHEMMSLVHEEESDEFRYKGANSSSRKFDQSFKKVFQPSKTHTKLDWIPRALERHTLVTYKLKNIAGVQDRVHPPWGGWKGQQPNTDHPDYKEASAWAGEPS